MNSFYANGKDWSPEAGLGPIQTQCLNPVGSPDTEVDRLAKALDADFGVNKIAPSPTQPAVPSIEDMALNLFERVGDDIVRQIKRSLSQAEEQGYGIGYDAAHESAEATVRTQQEEIAKLREERKLMQREIEALQSEVAVLRWHLLQYRVAGYR